MKRFIVLSCLFFTTMGLAQSDQDSLFQQARKLTAEKKYTEALSLLEDLCEQYPTNLDFSNQISRVYFWSGFPEKAKENLLKSQKPDQLNKEELDLLIQIEISLSDEESAINHSDLGISRFPDSKYHFTYLKAIVLESLERNEEALKLLDQIPESDADYLAADYLRTQLLRKQKNTISAGYFLTAFDQLEPQHIGFLEYMRKFKTYTQAFRVNYANMFSKNSFQFETDAYLKIKRDYYLYANVGVAESKSIFPQFRAGAEFYTERKHISASFGGRYLYFDKSNQPVLLTGHFAYTTNKSWSFNYRPFVLFLTNKILASHVLYIRKAFPRKESYIQLDMQYGNLPYFYFTTDVLNRLSAYRIGLNMKFRIQNNWFIQPILMYEREEYIPEFYRNRYTFQFILSHRF